MDATKIMVKTEVKAVLADLDFRMRHSPNAWLNKTVFRLSCCCGLRCCEIAGVDLGDFSFNSARPCIRIRKEITKGKLEKRKNRIVPLWWDKGTLEDLKAWAAFRAEKGAGPRDPFVTGVNPRSEGKRYSTDELAKRFKTAIRILGKDRVKQLHIHCGRHSFATLSLQAGRTLMEVRDALGHSNITTTSIYLHMIDRGELPDVFGG